MNNNTYIQEKLKEFIDEKIDDIFVNTINTVPILVGGKTTEVTTDYSQAVDKAREALNDVAERARELGIRQVGQWIKFPYRKGMKMTRNIDGSGGIMSAGCEVCGGKLVYIRGRYPRDKKRKVCPTCATEIIESLNSNCNNRDAYTESKPEGGRD